MAIELILSRLVRTEVDPLEVILAVLKLAFSKRSYGGVRREVREREREREMGTEEGTCSFALSPFPNPWTIFLLTSLWVIHLSERLEQVILRLY